MNRGNEEIVKFFQSVFSEWLRINWCLHHLQFSSLKSPLQKWNFLSGSFYVKFWGKDILQGYNFCPWRIFSYTEDWLISYLVTSCLVEILRFFVTANRFIFTSSCRALLISISFFFIVNSAFALLLLFIGF